MPFSFIRSATIPGDLRLTRMQQKMNNTTLCPATSFTAAPLAEIMNVLSPIGVTDP
jgi:hypothetical protein